jgi:hypothetical protein
MPPATARANAKKSSVRARVEHVFAHQKNRFGLFIRNRPLEAACRMRFRSAMRRL